MIAKNTPRSKSFFAYLPEGFEMIKRLYIFFMALFFIIIETINHCAGKGISPI